MFASLSRIFQRPGFFPASPPQPTPGEAQPAFVIANPALGLLNLAGPDAAAQFSADLEQLGEHFPRNIHVGLREVPRCNVLFLYCRLAPSGRIAGHNFSLHEVIREAGAHVAVVASEVPPAIFGHPEFRAYLARKSDWPCNLVITLQRREAAFAELFERLFVLMRSGMPMPTAWMRLAPTQPGASARHPVTIAQMNAGAISFRLM